MDEKSILLGVHSRARVVACRSSPIEEMDGIREWIAAVGCICTDNSLLSKGLYHGWFTEGSDQNVKSACFDKGYMADKLAVEWLHAFVMATKECA